MRVGISLLAIAPQRQAGLLSYAVGITRGLAATLKAPPLLFVSHAQHAFWQRQLADVRVSWEVGGPSAESRLARAVYESGLLARLAREKADVLFSPHLLAPALGGVPTVSTIHDLMWLHHTDTDFSWVKRAYLGGTLRRTRSAVAGVATVSEFCRADIAARLGLDPAMIAVTPNAPSNDFLAALASIDRTTPGHGARYLLSVASDYPHKRLRVLLSVFERIAVLHPELELRMAGLHGSTPQRLADLRLEVDALNAKVGGRVVILPRMDAAELARTYAGAVGLISASAFEGFGIPVAEALAAGCPVAASPAPAVVETAGGHAYLASDMSQDALVSAVTTMLAERHQASTRRGESARWALAHYSWERSASTLIQLLETAAART